MDPSSGDEQDGLHRIDGIDVAVGLAAVGGQPGIYVRLLARFVVTHQGDVGEGHLDPMVVEPVDLHLELHRLRGAASTLGLIAIDESARLLDAALAAGLQGAATAPLATALAAAMAETIAALLAVPAVAAVAAELRRDGR